MKEPDRIMVDVKSKEVIKKVKDAKYLCFNTNKEIFLYAVSLGKDMPTDIKGPKDGLFLDKDLNTEDQAIIYSVAKLEIGNIEELVDKRKVYDIVQRMANTGFSILEENMKNNSIENLEKKMLLELDSKFQQITQI